MNWDDYPEAIDERTRDEIAEDAAVDEWMALVDAGFWDDMGEC